MERIVGAPSKGGRRPTQVAPSKTPTVRPTAQKGGGGNKAAGSVEPTAANTPTVSVSPSGEVSTQHFGRSDVRQDVARKAHQEAVRSRKRVQRVRTYVRRRDRELTPKREVKVSKDFVQGIEKKSNLDKPVTVAEHKRSVPGPTKQKTIPVAMHQRKLPASTAILASDKAAQAPPNPKLKGTPEERKEARQAVRQAKKEVRASRAPQSLRIGMIQTPEQERNLRTVLSTGEEDDATRKEKLAATETGLVESYGFKNLKGGDADSEGWRQERRMYYPEPTNVRKGAENFYDEAKTDPSIPGGGGETSGQLAQTVQGSAFPERYEEHSAEAKAILNAFEGSKPSRKALKNLAAAKKEAKDLGLKVGGGGVGPAPPKLVKRTVVAETAMKEIEGEPYVWGGGHGSFDEAGKDCSGAVGYVLHKVEPNVMTAPLTSGDMGSVLKPGPGALTVYYNAGHTFLSYVNKKGETIYWGTSVGDSGAGGLGPHPAPSAEYLSEYNVGHVPGMGRKQALQLGAEPGSFTSAGSTSTPGTFSSQPGMTFSEGGTVATISEGAGAKKNGKPGFSDKPIELTPFQQLTKRVKKLQSLGVDVQLPGHESKAEAANKPGDSSLHQQLAALESKYSVGAV